MTFNTGRVMARRISKGNPTFLVVDECHHAASAENARSLAGDHIATLGLSATPERQYDDGLADVLVPRLGPIVFRYNYADAKADGLIAKFDLINVRIPLTSVEQAEYERLTRSVARAAHAAEGGSGLTEGLKILLQKRARVASNAQHRIPVASRLAVDNKGARMLLFHESIAAANEITSQISRREVSAIQYHTGIGPLIRRENLRLFRRRAFDVLVSCRALDEGLNVPDVGVAIVASSTASIRQRIQRLGRVLRPAQGKTKAVIFTVYATDLEEKRMVEEASAGVADHVEWRRVGVRDV
jgi:superfamily II DNA or RNA helicase